MGVMRFTVHPHGRITDEICRRIYMSGLDRVPWQSRAYMKGDVLHVERDVSDSGNMFCPWRVAGYGELTLATGSLMERERPYNLIVELARGKVNQVRTQLFEWQSIGLVAPKTFTDRLHDAVALFAQSATNQQDLAAAAAAAEKAIETAMEAGVMLANVFTEQALAARYRQANKLSVQLGANLGQSLLPDPVARLVKASFNTAVAPVSWHEVEPSQGGLNWAISDAQINWCHSQGLQVFAGPLLRLDQAGLPDWLYLWEGDFDNILSFFGEYVEKVVQRYKGKVQLWQCASRMNVGSVLSLGDVDKQRLAVRAIEIVRKLDPKTPAVMCFDQPWTEYMSTDEVEPPMYFADLLARAGIGLSGIGLEINLGYYPGGTYPRDLLDFSGLLDRWSVLGLPLYLMLTVPSGQQPDPQAKLPAKPLQGGGPGGHSQGTQNLWVSRFLPMLLAKPAVQGIVWNQLLDSQPHDYPHGGLFDAAGSPKSALTTLAALKRAHLS